MKYMAATNFLNTGKNDVFIAVHGVNQLFSIEFAALFTFVEELFFKSSTDFRVLHNF